MAPEESVSNSAGKRYGRSKTRSLSWQKEKYFPINSSSLMREAGRILLGSSDTDDNHSETKRVINLMRFFAPDSEACEMSLRRLATEPPPKKSRFAFAKGS